MNICLFCNKEFEGREERPNKYCSHKCHIAYTKTITKKICVVCGIEFDGYLSRQCCSLKCVHASMRLPEKSCEGCGKLFSPEKVKTKFCSKECEIQSHRKYEEPTPITGARWVPLTKGKFALIDEEDFERVSQHSWCVVQGKSTLYAKTYLRKNGERGSIKLHQFIINSNHGELVDHIDQDGLNCRKNNLRIVTKSQNRMNTKKKFGRIPYKGVILLPNGKFRAVVHGNGRVWYSIPLNTLEDAARAYDAEARKMHGLNGRYNFPQSGERSARY
jgi:hypothetical protein